MLCVGGTNYEIWNMSMPMHMHLNTFTEMHMSTITITNMIVHMRLNLHFAFTDHFQLAGARAPAADGDQLRTKMHLRRGRGSPGMSSCWK